MSRKTNRSTNNAEDIYFACECIRDDSGIHFVCPKCGKYHDDDFEALVCCISK